MKIAAFAAVFILLFGYFQSVYNKPYVDEYEGYEKYSEIEDPDVIFLGTSESWVGIVPMELYHDAGFTSFNLGHSWKSSVTFYYELKYALKLHHPKAVALDCQSMFTDDLPQNEEDAENVYRQALYFIKDPEIHRELLRDVCRIDPEEAVYYLFPLLRFHGRWSTLAEETDRAPEEPVQPDYMLGWYTYGNNLYDWEQIDQTITSDLWEVPASDEPIPNLDLEYFTKIVDLCRKEQVKLIAVIPPKVSEAGVHSSHRKVMQQFFDENDIPSFDYNSYEQVKRIGLKWSEDYFNRDHLNYYGAMKWSRVLAEDLSLSLQLPDHRGDNSAAALQMKEFEQDFYRDYGQWSAN